MKQFIYAKPPEVSICTIAFGGYVNMVNIDRIMFMYVSTTYNGEQYNIVLDMGGKIETWQVSEETYKELLEIEYGNKTE